MTDSAPGRRERQRAETTLALIRAARRLTAAEGLAGFTVEQLGDDAGVSRRTFFNYFASKEDAVLGVPIERSDAEAVAAFLAAGEPGETLSPTLLRDLAALAAARWRAIDLAPDSLAELLDAVKREPKLLGRMLQLAVEGEAADALLVSRREGLEPGDLRAAAAAAIVGTISRASAEEFLRPDDTGSFLDIFTRRLDAARALFATQTVFEESR